ncbi:hypothetical protein GOP47_0015377 [Adiantum capillus-veneris]|uniref:glucose-6-phosphate dehydrogenase (NADP(+)) n=1 Tax=Adiantum capillus-veneris TaxID=13818 RepID=A0A9D4UKI0_ADICA|nr:hypothetical protein GOP47_0015377 [Adiantum capillus-veneris]
MLCYRFADFFTICGQAIISVDGSPSYPRLIAQYAGHGIMLLLSFFPENQHKDFTKELHRLQKGPNTKESSVLPDQQSQKSTKGKEHMQSQQRGAEQTSESECLSIIILGAHERFSKQKLFSALFKLYVQGFFKNIKVRFFGYSNERLKDEEYLRGLRRCLERGKAVSSQEIVVELFLRSVSYIPGRYDDESSFRILENKVAAHEDNTNCQRGRLFYFALEPDFYAAVGKLIKENCMSTGGWNRVIIENPFEKDCEACEELGHWFTQEEIYRVDYYLGKEVVQDLLFMRFTNRLFLPIWNRDHIKQIKIVVKEEFGTEGSFNEKSIIRNIIQGHLLQVLCFLAMERPVSLKEDDIRDEKMKILKSI